MSPRFMVAAALGAAGAIAVTACSGGSSGTPAPVPTATPTGAFASVVNSSRGTLMLGLGAVKAIDYYARFLQPGLFPAFVRPNPTPACNPKTATATTVTTDLEKQAYSIAVAFYPVGDATCSRGITAAIEMYFPSSRPPTASSPQLATGYAVSFDAKGIAYEYDLVREAVYATTPLNVDAQINRYDPNSIPASLARPRPGKFPATFPLDFPPPQSPAQPLQPEAFVNDYYASVGSGVGTAQIGTASTAITNPSFFQSNNDGQTQYLGALDSLSVKLAPPGVYGESSYAATHSGSAYALSPIAPIQLANGSYQLGAGKTAWSFAPVQNGFLASNFSSATITDDATLSAGGAILKDAQSFEDVVNKVSVAVAFPAGSPAGYATTVTDLLRSAPATAPGPFDIFPIGQSVPYTYVFDGSPGYILDFTVVQ